VRGTCEGVRGSARKCEGVRGNARGCERVQEFLREVRGECEESVRCPESRENLPSERPVPPVDRKATTVRVSFFSFRLDSVMITEFPIEGLSLSSKVQFTSNINYNSSPIGLLRYLLDPRTPPRNHSIFVLRYLVLPRDHLASFDRKF
jgi:hypothetical protein